MDTRKMIVLCVAVLALAAFGMGSGGYKDKEPQPASGGETMTMKGMPLPEAQAFWNYIARENPYEKWGMFPGYTGMYEGQSPHGAYLKLYANEKAVMAAEKGEPMPPGAILVKENYAKDQKTLMAITPMYKVPGYNPDGGNWFWAKYKPDGTVDASGKVNSCIQCHTPQKDYIFSKPK
ncbi:MAG: cytochrome P460 family protein [Deltaproteobacteria bacterium]|nr:cytochrome P460 family protein [Deltaproteobacteria bacterium]